MRGQSKGVAWVNGHLLGRFWNIGPQYTLYVPEEWLKTGVNEVVVFDTRRQSQPRSTRAREPRICQLIVISAADWLKLELRRRLLGCLSRWFGYVLPKNCRAAGPRRQTLSYRALRSS